MVFPSETTAYSHRDLPAADWALHSLRGLILETWQQTQYECYRLLSLTRPSRASPPRPLPTRPPTVHLPRPREMERLSAGYVDQPDPDPSWQRGHSYTSQVLTTLRNTSQSLTLRGLTLPSHPPDLLTGTLNVNGLTLAKLTELLWYMDVGPSTSTF